MRTASATNTPVRVANPLIEKGSAMSSLLDSRTSHHSVTVPNGAPQTLADIVADEGRSYRDRGDAIGIFDTPRGSPLTKEAQVRCFGVDR